MAARERWTLVKTVTLLALLFLGGVFFAPIPASAQAASAASSASVDPSSDSGRFVGTPSTGASNNSSTYSYDSADGSGEYCITPSLSSSGRWSASESIAVTQDSVSSASGESGNEPSRVLDWNEAVALGSKQESSNTSRGASAPVTQSSQPLWVTTDDESYTPTRVLDWDEAVQLGEQEKASMTSSENAQNAGTAISSVPKN